MNSQVPKHFGTEILDQLRERTINNSMTKHKLGKKPPPPFTKPHRDLDEIQTSDVLRAAPGPFFFSFSYTFRQKVCQIIGQTPSPGLEPPLGNARSATGDLHYLRSQNPPKVGALVQARG